MSKLLQLLGDWGSCLVLPGLPSPTSLMARGLPSADPSLPGGRGHPDTAPPSLVAWELSSAICLSSHPNVHFGEHITCKQLSGQTSSLAHVQFNSLLSVAHGHAGCCIKYLCTIHRTPLIDAVTIQERLLTV